MDSIRGVLTRGRSSFMSHNHGADVEKGTPTQRGGQTPVEELPALISPTERLITFRLMVGITQDKSFANRVFHRDRAADNVGIYTRVCEYEKKAKSSFRWFSILINFVLGFQLIVAATLTAIGASQTSSSTREGSSSGGGGVAALGALNTVAAGFLTYLKGSGLPGRYKFYYNEWKRIRETIEMRERELSRPDSTADVYQIIAEIQDLYEETSADIEASVPDSFQNPSKARRDRAGASSSMMAHLRGLPSHFHASDHAPSTQNQAQAQGQAQSQGVQSYIDRVKGLEASYGPQIRTAATQASAQARQGGDKAAEASSTLKEVESDIDHTARQVRAAANDVDDFAQRRLGTGFLSGSTIGTSASGTHSEQPSTTEDPEKKT